MTIRHLKIFIAVVECGKMRLAAEKLFISQPSVSQAIQELENYYGIKLFDRLSQRLFLTKKGAQLIPYARHVVDAFESLDLMMKNAGAMPILRIGGSVSVGTHLLNDIIDKLVEKEPLEFQVVTHNTSRIEEMIKNSKLDIGVVEGTISSEELIIESVCDDELVIIVGKGHPLYNRDYVSLGELEDELWISREQGSRDRNQYEQFLHEQEIKIHRLWRCTNTETIKQTVQRGRGIAIISRMLIERELKEGVLRILPVEGVKVNRAIKLVYHKDKYLSKPIQDFIEICRDWNK